MEGKHSGDYPGEGTKQDFIPRNASFIGPRGGVAHKMDLATPREKHRSRHYEEIKSVEADLDKKKTFLREQAIQKDRQFQQNVKNLRIRISRFREKLQREIENQDEEYECVKSKFEEGHGDLNETIVQEIEDSYKVVESEWIPPQKQRLDNLRADFTNFVNVLVPATIENQSGRVTRHLIKSQEMFEIDNTKLLKRERKIVSRFEDHVKDVEENVYEQEKKRKSCFVLMEEDMNEQERIADRSEESSQTELLEKVEEVQRMQGGLAGIRQQTDSDILQTIEAAMSRLQKTVLDNFGSEK